MPRGNQILLLLILLIVIGGVSYYLLYLKPQKDYLPAALAVPASTIMAVQSNDLPSDMAALSQNEFYQVLSRNRDVEELTNDYHYLDSILGLNEDMEKALAGSPAVVSLHATSATRLQLLLLHQSEGDYDYNDIQSLMVEVMPLHTMDKRAFDNIQVYDVKDPEKQPVFSFAFVEGVLMLSRSSLLVEDAISSFMQNREKNSPIANRMATLRDENKIFINYPRLPGLLGIWLSPEWVSYLKNLETMVSFGRYDYKMEKDRFSLNGLVYAPKNETTLLQGLLGQQPRSTNIAAVLPQSTALYFSWGGDDFTKYHQHYKKWLEHTGKLEEYEQKKFASTTEQNLDPEKELVHWVGDEWAYALLEPASAQSDPDAVLIVRPKDKDSGLARINALSERVGRQLMSDYVAVEYGKYMIDKASFTGVFEQLFGEVASGMGQSYYTQVGEYILFSSSDAAMRKCIDAFEERKSLATQEAYKNFMGGFASRGNFFMYLNPGRALLLGKKYVRESYEAQYDENIALYKNIYAFGFQLVNNGDHFFSQVNLQADTRDGTGVELSWKAELDAEPAAAPWIVTNHDNGTKEILVQDKYHQLYLISNSGRILWKRRLGEPVQGAVEQMDLYKNGQYQYLFATTNKLYLLDHEGKDAGGYPLRLGSPTQTGVALFDFLDNKDYQYFVQGENRLYGFQGDGQPLEGWAPMETNGRMAQPVKQFSFKGVQYLYGITHRGILYVWDTKGKATVKPIKTGTQILNPLYINTASALSKFIVFSVDTAASLYSITLDSSISRQRFPAFGSTPFFEYIDTDGNGKNEYVLTGNNTIASYEPGKTTPAWKLLTSGGLTAPPRILYTGNRTWVAYTLPETGKVYLFSRAGTPFSGFPIEGTTAIAAEDMNGDKNLDIVVGNKDKSIYLYRLTY